MVREGFSEAVIFKMITTQREGSSHIDRWEKAFLLKEIASIGSPRSEKVGSIQSAKGKKTSEAGDWLN